MQTISVVHHLKKGDKVSVFNHYPNSILKNTNSEMNTQFMGWLLKPSEPRMIFDGMSDRAFNDAGSISYTGTYENIGNGLNITEGSFTAPVSGIYYFHFQGLTDNGDANFINIKHNGEIVASTFRSKRTVRQALNKQYCTDINFFFGVEKYYGRNADYFSRQSISQGG